MLSKRERTLLAALFWTAAIAAAGVSVYLAGERRAAVVERIGLAERELGALSTRTGGAGGAVAAADLEARVAESRSRLYASGEIDPYRFGILVRDLLRSEGLSIARYQTVEQGGATVLEFSVEGSALAMARFLQRVSDSPRWWTVSFLSVRSAAGDGSVQAVLRIGYEQAGKGGG